MQIGSSKISCKMCPKETIYMKSDGLFTEKNKKNIITLSSAEFTRSMPSVKYSVNKRSMGHDSLTG